jgi:hypothetical protein
VKTFAAYAAALAIGLGTAVFVLWLGRSTPVGTDISFAAASIVFALAIVARVLSAPLVRHWLGLSLALSLPTCILGIVMFTLVARLGEYFWAWLWSALGAVAASLIGAYFAAKASRA